MVGARECWFVFTFDFFWQQLGYSDRCVIRLFTGQPGISGKDKVSFHSSTKTPIICKIDTGRWINCMLHWKTKKKVRALVNLHSDEEEKEEIAFGSPA